MQLCMDALVYHGLSWYRFATLGWGGGHSQAFWLICRTFLFSSWVDISWHKFYSFFTSMSRFGNDVMSFKERIQGANACRSNAVVCISNGQRDLLRQDLQKVFKWMFTHDHIIEPKFVILYFSLQLLPQEFVVGIQL